MRFSACACMFGHLTEIFGILHSFQVALWGLGNAHDVITFLVADHCVANCWIVCTAIVGYSFSFSSPCTLYNTLAHACRPPTTPAVYWKGSYCTCITCHEQFGFEEICSAISINDNMKNLIWKCSSWGHSKFCCFLGHPAKNLGSVGRLEKEKKMTHFQVAPECRDTETALHDLTSVRTYSTPSVTKIHKLGSWHNIYLPTSMPYLQT